MSKNPLHDQKALNVLQAVYSHQLEKQEFGDLLHTLDEAILGLASAEFETEAIPVRLPTLEDLESHFELATRLDFKLAEDDEEREITQLCESNSSCFAVNHLGQVIALSHACHDKLGDIAHQPIERLPLRNEDMRGLRTAVQEMTADNTTRHQDRALFVRHSEQEHVAIFHLKHFRKSRMIVVLFDHLVWSDFVDEAVKRNFAFTPAECTVVRLLVDGKRPAEIALDLDRSIETVRSHIKSVQSKTHMRDTSGLIRLMCEIMTISANLEFQANGPKGIDLQLPAPVQLTYANQRFDATQMVGRGKPDPSRTALFVHGMLQGPYVTQKLRHLLAEDRIEMICASRPGYGATPAATSKDQFVQASMNHMLHLLDMYQIEKTVLVAHMLGMRLATRLAAHAPDRVAAIISISGVIPIMSKAQLKQQSRMHRMAMLAAKYSPATLGYISQIGERYLREGNEIKCLKQLFARSMPDQSALSDPETAGLLTAGFQHLIESGKSAFIYDSQSGIDVWQDQFRSISCPCLFLHGASDAAVPVQTVRDLVPHFPNWQFQFFEDAGQTLLHTHQSVIAEHLKVMIEETTITSKKKHKIVF